MSLSLEVIASHLIASHEAQAPLTVRYRAASGDGAGDTVTRYFIVASEILTNKRGKQYVRTLEVHGPGVMAGEPMREKVSRIMRHADGSPMIGADGEPVRIFEEIPKARTLTVAAWTPSQPSGITTVREGIVSF